jgi:hypothetical protein
MKKIIEAHKIFVTESPIYMAGRTPRWAYLLYYPIAYLTFMFLSIFNK